MTSGIFRWKAISALAATLLVLAVLWAVFGDLLVKRNLESVGSEVLGAEVDVASLHIAASRTAVEIGGLQVANPFDLTKNLLEARTIVLSIDPLPLLEKKVVVNRMTLSGLRFMTTRRRPARSYASGNSIAGRLRTEGDAWVRSVKAPLLLLAPIDTIKSLVLEPSNLATVKAVNQLTFRADSVKGAFQANIAALRLQALADSTQALARRLAATKPGALGLAGAVQALQDARAGVDRINQTKQRIAALERDARTAAGLLAGGVKSVDSARRSDYEFAKGLLKLPKVEAPRIGEALFGPVSVARFEQVIYWARMAEEAVPPGLKPAPHPGPVRMRMAGRTYRFAREHTDPDFLLRLGELSFTLGGDTVKSAFAATITGLTTQPSLYGRPATFKASGETTGRHALSARIGGMLDHTGPATRDSVHARLSGIELPSIGLPGLPFTVTPGRGTSEMTVDIRRGQLSGRWSMRTTEAAWAFDSARKAPLNTLEGAVWKVLQGLTVLDVTAEVSGTLASPRIAVRSSIDQAIAERLRALLGEQLVKAEAKARAAVDKLVADRVEPIVKQVASVTSLIDSQLGGSKLQLDQLQQQLEAEIKRLGGPASRLPIRLPKLKP